MLSIASSQCIWLQVVTFILKFGGDLSGKFWQRLGTEMTSLDLKWRSRLSRLNGGNSQVYCLIAAIVMTLSVIKCHILLQAFSSAIFHICGTSHNPSVSAELLVTTWCFGVT